MPGFAQDADVKQVWTTVHDKPNLRLCIGVFRISNFVGENVAHLDGDDLLWYNIEAGCESTELVGPFEQESCLTDGDRQRFC